MIDGFNDFYAKLISVTASDQWKTVEADFSLCKRILTVGNGGNLAVCDHAAIDIARLTDKSASAPGSGILASSLINDASHDDWVKNWFSISLRGLPLESIKSTMLIGVSSSGYSLNICKALDMAVSRGCKACLISAVRPSIPGVYSTIVLDVDEYHTSEVMTLALFYQLIHSAGFTCPSISTSTTKLLIDDYKR